MMATVIASIAKKQAAEQLWLAYFNKVLYEKGFITEIERNRMKLKIDARGKLIK